MKTNESYMTGRQLFSEVCGRFNPTLNIRTHGFASIRIYMFDEMSMVYRCPSRTRPLGALHRGGRRGMRGCVAVDALKRIPLMWRRDRGFTPYQSMAGVGRSSSPVNSVNPAETETLPLCASALNYIRPCYMFHVRLCNMTAQNNIYYCNRNALFDTTHLQLGDCHG